MSKTLQSGKLRRRLSGAALSISAFALLVVAFCLDPSPYGHGTHTQLGFPSCPWVMVLHKPCPTCGMTTAFSHAAHGRLWASFQTQPFGALLALMTAGAVFLGLHAAVTGSRAVTACELLTRPLALWVFACLAVAAWVYKWITWTDL